MKKKTAVKKTSKKRAIFLENSVGWYGALATLSAYFLVSFGLANPQDLRYQLLNLTGAIGLGTICYFKKTYQPLFVNIVWAVIALMAIILILF